MCLKCKTITLGESPTQCQNCGENFLDYQIMKTNLESNDYTWKYVLTVKQLL